jgi:hypothetical protein
MRCTTKYVGLDVHQATTLSVVHDANAPGKQVYEAQSRGSWLDRLRDRGCRFRADVMRELRRNAPGPGSPAADC